jgi:hypothetical protein
MEEINNAHSRRYLKRIGKIGIILCILSLLSIPSLIHCTEGIEEKLSEAILLYDEGNFQEASIVLKEIIQDTTATEEEEICARTYLAFSLVARDLHHQAKSQFIEILKIKKDFFLNPEFVSPKIIEVFKEAEKVVQRNNSGQIILTKESPPSMTRCLVKSSVLPGWGQISRGENKKGRFLIGAFSVSLAALTLSHLAYLSAENNYMNAETRSDIEYQYSRYNFTYKTRYVLMEVSLFIWLYSMTDIFLNEPPIEENE